MNKLSVKGGKKLKGAVKVHGAKNAVLPILAATILTDGEVVLENVPLLSDVAVFCQIMCSLGVQIKQEGSTLTVCANGLDIQANPDSSLSQRLRASNLFLGPLMARAGRARLAFPGGCAIGSRPMDYHIKALEAMGASVELTDGCIDAVCSGLYGAEIYFDFPSVGATENALLAAVLARGDTVIKNAAREPEVADLARFLKVCGADIRGAGTDTIYISGVKALHGGSYQVMPDRIEAGTLLCAAAITGGEILLCGYDGQSLAALLHKLHDCGCLLGQTAEGLSLTAPERLKAVDIRTQPYPGFPTDMQPQMMALLSVAEGATLITESIFENRFRHAGELARMGADIKVVGEVARIIGKPHLTGAGVEAADLRAGAALVLAALAAEGESQISGVEYIDRGYQSLEQSLSALGADIRRIKL